ncbi:MAG: DUF3445 domain-containing protein [Planctomycetaceae bacterium]|jgi:hypothetical protein|nr:DUF3445 domain-containing protein [Planctomycetaceae bacterium]MDG2390468.1 DUF3445 domain-containing protein [Planctomycetaceae bacterium]
MSDLPHPYRDGYRLTPQLKTVSHDQIFTGTKQERQRLISGKQQIPSDQAWLVEEDCPLSLQNDVFSFLKNSVPEKITQANSLKELAPLIAEDFVIHRQKDGRDFMSFGAVMLPTGWRPDEMIGKSFREIHSPIPGMNLNQSESLVDAMIHSGPFERYVWGVRFSDRLNDHPDQASVRWNDQQPQICIKLERQVTVGFPAHSALLFLIRQSTIPQYEIDKPALRKTLRSMSEDQLKYKGINDDIDLLLNWLDS